MHTSRTMASHMPAQARQSAGWWCRYDTCQRAAIAHAQSDADHEGIQEKRCLLLTQEDHARDARQSGRGGGGKRLAGQMNCLRRRACLQDVPGFHLLDNQATTVDGFFDGAFCSLNGSLWLCVNTWQGEYEDADASTHRPMAHRLSEEALNESDYCDRVGADDMLLYRSLSATIHHAQQSAIIIDCVEKAFDHEQSSHVSDTILSRNAADVQTAQNDLHHMHHTAAKG